MIGCERPALSPRGNRISLRALVLCLFALAGCRSDQPPAPPPSPPPAPVTAAGDWLNYRGNAACQGLAAGRLNLPLRLAWRFKTGDAIQSSAVVDRGLVLVGSDDHALYALALDTGRQRWRFLTGDRVEAPPAVDGDTVYVGSADNWFYALAADTGALRWKIKTGDKILAAAVVVARPADAVAPVTLPADAPRPEPAGLPASDRYVLVGSYDHFLYCFNAGSGQMVWRYATENWVNGAVAIDGALAVFGGCDMKLHRVRLADGVGLPPIDLGAPIANTPAVADGRVYVGHYNNAFVCADLATGRIAWTYTARPYPFFSSPAVDADGVVFGARDKYLHCVARQTGAPRWSFATQGRVDSSPVICDGKVIVGSADGRVYILNRADGAELAALDLGAAVTASPAVVGGRVLIGAQDGMLYCYGPPVPGGAP